MFHFNIALGSFLFSTNDVYFHLKGNNGIFLKGGPYSKALTTYHSNACFDDGTYDFTVLGDYQHGIGSGNCIVCTK